MLKNRRSTVSPALVHEALMDTGWKTKGISLLQPAMLPAMIRDVKSEPAVLSEPLSPLCGDRISK
jgi:hypothetical protein